MTGNRNSGIGLHFLSMCVIPILFLSFTFFICNSTERTEQKKDFVNNTTKNIKPDTITLQNLTAKQKKILAGAKKCLEEKFNYDMTMAYVALNYKDGSNTGKLVCPNGDLDPKTGVCVEVTIRALRYAGIVDLQEAIHDDIKNNFDKYPMSRWSAKTTDVNIDHRRVPNQLVWFKRNWKEIDVSSNDWQPGDIVVWDMDKDSWGDHIGIISDKNTDGKIFVIHNFPSPGYVAEEDVLNRWKIIGHFRVKE